MGLLTKLGTGQGYLKAGFLGFPKSGKTYTSALLAAGLRRFFKLKGPIAFFDTEGGSEYVAPMLRKETGGELVGVRSRAFSDLITVGRECEKDGVAVLIVDSISHIWRELCAAYLKQVNQVLAQKKRSPRKRLEFQDWSAIKDMWAEWPDFYLNSRLHIIICGRAGYEWSFEEHEVSATGETKKELVKTGIKMKVESEFGFEPSLLVEMERVQDLQEKTMAHRATILGDRFGAIDGKDCDNPTFDFFLPHVQMLVSGAHAPIDTAVKTDTGVDESGDDEFNRERKARVILCEEIQGAILKLYPSQTGEDKKGKMELLESTFKTRSWTKVESLDSKTLREGLEAIRTKHEMAGAGKAGA